MATPIDTLRARVAADLTHTGLAPVLQAIETAGLFDELEEFMGETDDHVYDEVMDTAIAQGLVGVLGVMTTLTETSWWDCVQTAVEQGLVERAVLYLRQCPTSETYVGIEDVAEFFAEEESAEGMTLVATHMAAHTAGEMDDTEYIDTYVRWYVRMLATDSPLAACFPLHVQMFTQGYCLSGISSPLAYVQAMTADHPATRARLAHVLVALGEL